ncbi:MAG: hypothetical protein EXS15_03105 [Phycisphaerales bacterium]|nr:hypothetical protein [Phycisphaerales bacterium]
MGSLINPPPLLLDVQRRIAPVVIAPPSSLMWAGVVTAVMILFPLVGAVDALMADGRTGADLSSPEAIDALGPQLADTFMHLVIGVCLMLGVVLPLTYGAVLMALRAIRNQPPRRTDLFAAYLRPCAFSIFSVMFLVVGAIPLVLWIIVALIVGTVVGVVAALSSDADSSAQVGLITLTVMVVGVPFVVLSVYLQFRFGFAGVTLIDPVVSRTDALGALAQSWRMTCRQNTPLTRVGCYAVWTVIRSTILGYGIGFVTRGMPECVALIAGSYEVLTERVQPHKGS